MELPTDFFTITTFSTLAGSAVVVYFLTGVIAYLANSDNTQLKKWLSFGLSFVVSFIGVLLLKEHPWSAWLMAFLNAFLIFATVIGGNAIFSTKQPAPTLTLAVTTLSRQAAKSPMARKTRTTRREGSLKRLRVGGKGGGLALRRRPVARTRTTLGTHLFRTRWF